MGSDDIDQLRAGLDDNDFLYNNKTNTNKSPNDDSPSRSISGIVNSKDLLHFRSSYKSKERPKKSRVMNNPDFKLKALDEME